MYCAHPSCKKEVDINSVALDKKARMAGTITNENGLSFTRISQGDNKIVNVCKSCGKPDYLFSSEAEAVTELQKASEKAHLEKQGVRLVNWILLIIAACIILAGIFNWLSGGDNGGAGFTALIIVFILWIICSGKTHL